MGCIALVRCVLVLRCGLAGVVWCPYAGWSLHTDTTPHHEITQQISRKLLRMDILTSKTCWALNKEIIKQVTSSWSLFTQLHITILLVTSCFTCLRIENSRNEDKIVPECVGAKRKTFLCSYCIGWVKWVYIGRAVCACVLSAEVLTTFWWYLMGGDLPLSHRCNCSFFVFSIILLYVNSRLNLIFLFNSSLYKNKTVYNTRLLIVRSTACILHVVWYGVMME